MTKIQEALRLSEEAFMKIADLRNIGKIQPEVIAFETLYIIRAARAQEQEPVWNVEECDRVVKTLRYIQGIAERGFGRAMREDETIEQFVLGYVKQLEAAPVSIEAAVLAEREACAKVCEKAMIQMNYSEAPYKQCAAAIRARSEK